MVEIGGQCRKTSSPRPRRPAAHRGRRLPWPKLGGFHAPFDKDMRWSDAGFEPSDDNRVEQFRRLALAGLKR